jgi:hypothetical protein
MQIKVYKKERKKLSNNKPKLSSPVTHYKFGIKVSTGLVLITFLGFLKAKAIQACLSTLLKVHSEK